MTDFYRNIFYYYRGAQRPDQDREQHDQRRPDPQLENNTTKALINTLEHCESTVALEFLNWLGIAAAEPPQFELQKATLGAREIRRRSQRLLLGLVPPGGAKDICLELNGTVSEKGDSRPDAWIYGDDFVVLVESKKVESKEGVSLEPGQMQRHYLKLRAGTGQQPDCKVRTWAEVHRFFKDLLDKLAGKDKWIVEQFTQYLEWIGMAEFTGLEPEMFDYFASRIDDRKEEDRQWVRGTMRSFAEKILEGLQAVDSSFYQDYDVGKLLLKDNHCWVAFGYKDKEYREWAHQSISLYDYGLDVFVNVELKPAVDRLRKKIGSDKQKFRDIILGLPEPFTVWIEERKHRQGAIYDYYRIASLETDKRKVPQPESYGLKDPKLGQYGFVYIEKLLKQIPLPYLAVRRRIDRNRALELSQGDGRPLVDEVVGIMKEFHPLVEFINKPD